MSKPRRCESAYAAREGSGHPGKWILQTYHGPTGLPWSDQHCPHFPTKAAAIAASLGEAVYDAYCGAIARGYTSREALGVAKSPK